MTNRPQANERRPLPGGITVTIVEEENREDRGYNDHDGQQSHVTSLVTSHFGTTQNSPDVAHEEDDENDNYNLLTSFHAQ